METLVLSSTRLEPGTAAHRHRLLEGMAHAVAVRGYADTTIADIVREASVSRRTFYEHFQTKADCLIALYQVASHNGLKVLREAIDPAHDWEQQLDRALGAYLGCMAASPVLMRTLFIEILGLGPDGLAARRRVNEEIAAYMLEVMGRSPKGAALTPELAMAVVGGIHELVLQAIEDGRVTELAELTATASQLVKAVARRS